MSQPQPFIAAFNDPPECGRYGVFSGLPRFRVNEPEPQGLPVDFAVNPKF
jgi:hypothetical protein